MKFYFVSDDSYFLLGIEAVLSESEVFPGFHSFYVNINRDDFSFVPEPKDVVVLAVFNLLTRRELMRLRALSLCRMIIMFRAGPYRYLTDKYNPCLINWNTAKDDFLGLLNQLATRHIKWHQVPLKGADVLFYLGAGFSHDEVAEFLGLSSKSIYAIRRNVNILLGLGTCNSATSIILCRDIVEMGVYRKR